MGASRAGRHGVAGHASMREDGEPRTVGAAAAAPSFEAPASRLPAPATRGRPCGGSPDAPGLLRHTSSRRVTCWWDRCRARSTSCSVGCFTCGRQAATGPCSPRLSPGKPGSLPESGLHNGHEARLGRCTLRQHVREGPPPRPPLAGCAPARTQKRGPRSAAAIGSYQC